MSTSADQGADRRGARGVALVAAVVSLLAALAFPFAPVTRDDVTYRWESGPGSATSAAMPLLPYHPVRLEASVSCAVAAEGAGEVLATAPPRPGPGAEPVAGLRVRSDGAAITVTSGPAVLGPVAPPPDCARLVVVSTAEATVLSAVTGAGVQGELARVAGDVRPAVAGVFVTGDPPPGGVALEVLADTRFQTTITPLKAALCMVAVAGLAVVLVALTRGDRRHARTMPRAGPARRRGPRPADVGVLGALALWQVIGPLSVDDGYIGGIVRERFAHGQVGTVFRWLNSPEAPFGWFYDVLAAVALLAPDPFWLRLPSTVLGAIAWLLLSRAVLPRLRVPSTTWWSLTAGVVFLAWWLPFGLGVRPEPWVVLGWTVVLLLVERALVRRAVAPVAGAVVVAGATLAVTPTGLVAVTPLLVAALPLVRLVAARRRDLGTALPLLAAVAAGAITLVLVFADQSWAAVLDSVRVRRLIGGDRPPWEEYVRYTSLFTAGDAEGSLGRRAPVIALLLALLTPVLARPRWTGRLLGVAPGPARRVAAGALLALGVLALTPTKWTHHFGAFAVIGTALPLVVLRLWWTATPSARTAPVRAATGAALAAGAGWLIWSGWNQWHWISSYAIMWSTLAPQVAGIRVADAVLAVGLLLAATSAVVGWRRRRAPDVDRTTTGLLAVPPALVLATVALVVAVELLSFTRTAVQRRDSYTLATDSLASLSGGSCGLADRLRVESDPVAGLLTPTGPGPATGAPPPGAEPLVAAGQVLPGWWGPGVRTAALAAPPDPGDEGLPLTVTVSGPVLEPGQLALEITDAAGAVTTLALDEAATQYSVSASVAAPGARDLRVDRAAPTAGATVRLVSAPDAPPSLGFSVPRRPRTVAFAEVLPAGVPAAVDWPGAFLFPCTPLATLRDGAAALPGWRISTDARSRARSGYISYTASQGGPWTTARTLVREQDVPVYLPGLPTTDVATLARWVPVDPLGPGVETVRTPRTEAGTTSPGPLTVGHD